MKGNNLVILRGNLGANPETRTIPGGSRVVELRVATNSRWKTDHGEVKERTDWHRVEAWGPTGDYCASYLKKGDPVQVFGSIRNDIVEGEKGKRLFSTVRAWEVHGAGKAPAVDTGAAAGPAPGGYRSSQDDGSGIGAEMIPF